MSEGLKVEHAVTIHLTELAEMIREQLGAKTTISITPVMQGPSDRMEQGPSRLTGIKATWEGRIPPAKLTDEERKALGL